MPGTRRAARILAQSAQPLKHVTRIMGEKRILHSWPRRGQAARALGAGSGVLAARGGAGFAAASSVRSPPPRPSHRPRMAPLFGDAAFALPTRGRSIWQGRGLSHHPPQPSPRARGSPLRELDYQTGDQGAVRMGPRMRGEGSAPNAGMRPTGAHPGRPLSRGEDEPEPAERPSLCRENGRQWSDFRVLRPLDRPQKPPARIAGSGRHPYFYATLISGTSARIPSCRCCRDSP